MDLMIRISLCTLGGILCSLAARVWIRHLEDQRSLDDRMTLKAERLMNGILALLGGLTGAFTVGIAAPVFDLMFLLICAVVSVMDGYFRIIPNQTILAIFALKLLTGVLLLLGVSGLGRFDLAGSLIGLAALFLVFVLPGFFGKNVGAGDVKLAAAMGFLLGITNALMGIIVMGLLVIGYSLFQRRAPFLSFLKANIPMGPFIAFGMVVALLGPSVFRHLPV